jgi:diadenosine tetraphosphatase ApaH/serine/threonine PP2A family protein phosphatase
LQVELSSIIKEALEANCKDFVHMVERAKNLLCNENGRIRNFEVIGKLINIQPKGEALIIGDLHGDLESLLDILKISNFLQKMSIDKDAVLIFLGDYGDRGDYSAEVYYTVLKLKILFPEQIVLMRGNHEGPEDLIASPHDLPLQFQVRFGEEWGNAYSKTRELFACLYNAVLVEGQYLMVHGGLTPQLRNAKDLAYAHLTHPQQSILEDLLWSDPNEIIRGTCASPRGAGKLFGEEVTNHVLKSLDVKILIRGHEPCEEGYKINHKDKVLTLFSRKGPPYFNSYGAYLQVPLSKKFENAGQLIPYVHKF